MRRVAAGHPRADLRGPAYRRGHARCLEGRTAHGSDGAKLGRLEEIYLYDFTDRPSWGVVRTGHLGVRRFVPLADARIDGDVARLRVRRDQIKDAPSLREDQHFSPEVESRLRATTA